LLTLLPQLGITVSTYTHKAVFTVEESEEINSQIPGAHTKNLFVKDKKGNFFLLIAENHALISLNKIHPLIGAKSRVSFGKAEDLMKLLGVTPGSINAFAPINDKNGNVAVIIDKPLLLHALINCHPLTNEMTSTISKEDLLRFLEHIGHIPQIVELSGPKQA